MSTRCSLILKPSFVFFRWCTYDPAKWRTSSRRNSIMWKRERTCRSPLGAAFSMTTLDTTWLVPHSGRCDQASGCSTRFMRTVIRFLSSAKIVGVDQRRGRVDQVVIGERAAVDGLGRALEAEVPDLGERAIDAQWAHRAQLLQRRLHRQAGIDQHVVDVDAEDLLHALLAVGL